MDYQTASGTVMALAKRFIEELRAMNLEWSEAFWRFEAADGVVSTNGSVVTGDKVQLIDSVAHAACLTTMGTLGQKLRETLEQSFCVCLLVVRPNFTYEIKYERLDTDKWRITKLNGASGRPAGL